MENGPKSKKWEKLAKKKGPRPEMGQKWPKKNGEKMGFGVFCYFLAIFSPFRAEGHFLFFAIFFPFWISARFPFYTRRPDSQLKCAFSFCSGAFATDRIQKKDLLGTEKVPQRNCVTKIWPNVQVNFLVRFASKPLFYWVMTGNPLELFRKFFGAVRSIIWLCGSFLAPEPRS